MKNVYEHRSKKIIQLKEIGINVAFGISCRGSADNITVVVINLKDRKFSVSEIKKNQL